VTYHWNLTDYKFSGPDTCSDSRFEAGLSGTRYVPSTELLCLHDNGYYYTWRVMGNDGVGNGSWSSDFAVNITANLTISLASSTINFGSLDYLDSNDTTGDSPSPFVLSNDGNVHTNVTVNSTSIWDVQPSDSSYYQFKVDNVSGEEGAFNWSGSVTSWFNMPISAEVIAIDKLNYTDTKDSAEVDIRVEVPSNEGPGVKTSTIIFTSRLDE